MYIWQAQTLVIEGKQPNMFTANKKYRATRPELISDYRDELGNEDVILDDKYTGKNILRRMYDYCHPWLYRAMARIEDYGAYTRAIRARS